LVGWASWSMLYVHLHSVGTRLAGEVSGSQSASMAQRRARVAKKLAWCELARKTGSRTSAPHASHERRACNHRFHDELARYSAGYKAGRQTAATALQLQCALPWSMETMGRIQMCSAADGPVVSVRCSTILRCTAALRVEDCASLRLRWTLRPAMLRSVSASSAHGRVQKTRQQTREHTGSVALILHILASDTEQPRAPCNLMAPHRQQLAAAFGSQPPPADAASRQSSSVCARLA
jgi:hypothetical protein